MPHEAAFIAVLAWIWARLAASAGLLASETLVYAALVAAITAAPGLARACSRRWAGPWPGRIRLFAFVPLMWFVFGDLRRSIPLFHPGHADALLQAWDLRLLGCSLPQWFDGRFGALPTEALSLCYGLFFAYLLAAATGWLFAPAAKARAFYAGLFTLYAAGFAGYVTLPALGPYATMPFAHPVHGYGVTRLLLRIVPFGTNRADAFPSLHCAVTAFILGFDVIAGHRRRAAWCALPVALLWLSTLVLRFHYAVDVGAGFVLAGCCLALAAAMLLPRAAPVPRHPPRHTMERPSMPYVIALTDPRALQPGLAGGKAAGLARLLRGGFTVPEGVVVTTDAYRAMTAGNLPPGLAEELAAVLDPACPYAVRSSATAEDLAEASFAGQHDTVLGCAGLPAVLEAVRRCFASLHGDRAVAYRRDRAIASESDLAMAVVVQRMVAAEAAGVAFTLDPVGGALDEIHISAHPGLGEGVVNGEAEVDRFVLAKSDLALRSAVGTRGTPVPLRGAGRLRRRHRPRHRGRARCAAGHRMGHRRRRRAGAASPSRHRPPRALDPRRVRRALPQPGDAAGLGLRRCRLPRGPAGLVRPHGAAADARTAGSPGSTAMSTATRPPSTSTWAARSPAPRASTHCAPPCRRWCAASPGWTNCPASGR